MTMQLPPSDDDALSPFERELAQLYRRLPDAAPDARIDAAVLAQARAAVNLKPRRSLTRWSVGFASAAVIVLAAGIAWRSDRVAEITSSPSPAVNRPAPMQAEPAASAPRDRVQSGISVPPVAEAASGKPDARRMSPARQGADKAASNVAGTSELLESRAPRPTPGTPERSPSRSIPAPGTALGSAEIAGYESTSHAKKITASVLHEYAPAAAPPPPAEAAMKAAPAALMQANAPAPSPASSTAARIAGTPAQRVERIRRLLHGGQHAQALTALDALHKAYPGYPIPADLRAMRAH